MYIYVFCISDKIFVIPVSMFNVKRDKKGATRAAAGGKLRTKGPPPLCWGLS